ncbi:dual specificity protein kinase TTK isoform X2 [Rhineura floridana]|nr:dual specificity protein kinase TTK isoform X2 [Rhineura floridana]XP_061479185.1 dual specificity protein kinase TTK isoform X2 [Rhineura floridana]XP_061479186.1 dual specificity protein kinase TTK isoform X2 [Rhineura floridana]
MQEEDLNEKGLFVASIMSRVRDLKSKYKNEDNITDELNFTKVSADTTDNSGTVNQIMMTANNPEDWLNFLLKLEKKGNPQTDISLLNRLIGRYSQAVAALSAEKYSENESYAHILVRFAELKAIEDPEEARDQFHLVRLNCKKFAFVHVAFAQFELSQGNVKKCKQLLEKAAESRALPLEMLEIALRNLSLQRKQLLSLEEKENLTASDSHNIVGNFLNRKKNADSSEIIASTPSFCSAEKNNSPQATELVLGGRKPLKQLNKSNPMCPFGRVPIKLVSDDEGDSVKMATPCATPIAKRQIPGTNLIQLSLHESKRNGNYSYPLGDLKPLSSSRPIDLEMSNEESSEVATNSTLTLKNKHDSSYIVKQKGTEEQHEEPRTTELSCLERLQPHCLENDQKEQLRSNYFASGNKWLHPEMMHNTNSEGKTSSFGQPAFQVSKRCSPPDPILQNISPPETASKRNSQAFVGTTPSNNMLHDYMACFSTPVVTNDFLLMGKATTPYNQLSYSQPCTPTTPFQVHTRLPISASAPTNECIAIKGKWYSVLKQIGSGGSSKVFQVLDEKKQLYAIKYVSLEEADEQTLESYKNEIAHLIKLQQHSDKIIRLYDYEIGKKSIYMVMECGNIDLNSWLKKKKTVNPWERKSYWKNMLEAVHTIHQHGIVHSDLKPANFLLVDGMLKLIDFGIANQMQPDVTSILKDSQVGTVNYMAPEVIKDMSTCGENGKPRSKISPKNDVWSLGCILYCMTYGRTPFQHITNQITKLHAIIDPSYEIIFPDIVEKDLQDVLKRCLVRNPKQRISVSELLVHPYVHIQADLHTGCPKETTAEMKRILGHLIGLNSPNSISRAAKTLYEQCNNGEGLDVSAFANCDNQKTWSTK